MNAPRQRVLGLLRLAPPASPSFPAISPAVILPLDGDMPSMLPQCDPLCCFGDRLFFTTFPHPAPKQDSLNSSESFPEPPRIRGNLRDVSSDTAAKYYYFTIDDQLVYMSFFQDWGPLNIAMVYKACIYIHSLLNDAELAPFRLVLYTSDMPQRKANAALLMALFSLIVQQRAPWDAFQPIAELEFMPFRDAGRGRADFSLTIQDCLWGMFKAMQNGLCDLNAFDVNEYEHYEKVENGDWNWITPHFIAFASPMDPAYVKAQKEGPGSPTKASPAKLALQRKLPMPFQNCLEYFEQANIKLVVRLNNELYDRDTFLERGIDHMELYFDDGTNPTDDIIRRFIDVSDEIISAGGSVAVHCKAGLGRTGTLIGAYLVWKYGFTASEAIAFMRILRPGCVVGPQQQFMYSKQLEWAKWAAVDEIRRTQAAAAPPQAQALAESDAENLPMDSKTPPNGIAVASIPLPPVTPSKHVAAASAKAKSIVPPGQPRKTPNAKRMAAESSDEEDEDDTLPQLGLAPPARASRSPAKTTVAKVTASEQRPTRVTRSTAAATRKPGTALSSVSSKANGQAPNKIPRLARAVAGASKPTEPSGLVAPRRTRRAPSPTSRLPTLVPSKRPHHASVSSLGEIIVKAVPRGVTTEWMKNGADAVVKPGSKSERPGLRSVRRRRSSFSAADVIA
ncbi:phosphatases II [Auriscalpium vulgare]|uniref:Phosphatases II n=1 Tax=Auriscalpium vulgare TaxID=40419 RepID=A0ACB8S841_9AGAM|nr:phosphatases II [Auriscalpium vulgare]